MREFLVDRAIIRKWTQIVGTTRQRIRSTATVDSSLQQLSRANLERYQGVVGQDYMIYIDKNDVDIIGITIQKGDQITIKNGDTYKVNSIYPVVYGSEAHLELFVTRIQDSS